MNNSEIIKILAQRTGLTLKETKQLCKQTVEVFSETLGHYVGFSIPDLGTFGTHIREARQAYDLNRKSHVLLPPKRLVSFSPAVGLKDEIKEVVVEPSAPRPPAAAKEAAPVAEVSPEDQEATPEDTRESLRRELQAEKAVETAEQTLDDAPAPPDEVATEEAAQPEASPPEPADAPEPAGDQDQVTKQQPESSATTPDTATTEPAATPETASQGDQAAPQPPESTKPGPEAENPEPGKQP